MSDKTNIIIRLTSPSDVALAEPAAELIAAAAETHHIGRRNAELLRTHIANRQAVVALHGGDLVGFSFFSVWRDRMVSFSGMVVAPDHRRCGIGGQMKRHLDEVVQSTCPTYPRFTLTTSPIIQRIATKMGFAAVELNKLTSDPEFWQACNGCSRSEELKNSGGGSETPIPGRRCCCSAFVCWPDCDHD